MFSNCGGGDSCLWIILLLIIVCCCGGSCSGNVRGIGDCGCCD